MKISLLGLGEELGLPSFKNNRQNFETRLLDAIEAKFNKQNKVIKVNTFSYMFNKSWHMTAILKSNLNLNELEILRRVGNDFAKKESLMMHLFSPKIKKQTYNDITLNSFLQNPNVILYDIGMNDFMYYCGTNVVASHIILHKNKPAKKVLENDQVYINAINGVKENIKEILKINPNSKIYILGFSLKIYVPKFIYFLYKHTRIYKELNKAINKWNNMLKELESNNIIFLDLSIYQNKEEALAKIPNMITIGKASYNSFPYLGPNQLIKEFKNDNIHLKEKAKEINYLKKMF